MGHDAQSPPRQPIPVWVAQALLAVVQSPGLMPSGKGLCIFPPPGIAASSGVGSGPTDRPDAATTRTAARRTTHNGRPQAACDLLSSAVFPPGLAHVWAFPPQSAENGARGWLQGRGRERGGGRAAELSGRPAVRIGSTTASHGHSPPLTCASDARHQPALGGTGGSCHCARDRSRVY